MAYGFFMGVFCLDIVLYMAENFPAADDFANIAKIFGNE